jgi:carbon-monoxide dehydrogenase large subunit
VGADPVELRRRNLASADELPLATAGGVTYDRADPGAALDRALERLGLDRWRAEQAERRRRGDPQELGIGVASYAQTSGRGTPADSVQVEVGDDGTVVVSCASPSHGQGHHTTWAGLVADRLGVDPVAVVLVEADTDAVARGLGTGGSRSSQIVASALVNACQDIIDQARPLAAAELEAAPDDLVVVGPGHGLEAGLAVAGVPTRRVTWSALAARHPNRCLDAARFEPVAGSSHPYGAHASVVEVDTETGAVKLLAHVAVDDCGIVLQPALVEGQQHGGAVAGIAQALFEHAGFDHEANPVAATFGTYLLPAASEVCSIDAVTMETPTENNQLGTRGIGENGCNGATAAVHNAVIDALHPRGVEHIDLPLTPMAIWRALRP